MSLSVSLCLSMSLSASLPLCPSLSPPQDGLLSQGHGELIRKLYSKMPQVSPEGRRLQVRFLVVQLFITHCTINR